MKFRKINLAAAAYYTGRAAYDMGYSKSIWAKEGPIYTGRDKRRMKAKGSAYHRGGTTAMRNAQAIARLNKRTGGFIGLELKFLDRFKSFVIMGNATDMSGAEKDPLTVLCLNSLAQGTGESERLGRHCEMRSIKVKGTLVFPATEAQTAPAGQALCAVYLVMDTQTNGAQLNSEDVFTNFGAQVGNLTQPMVNMENTDRFRILDSFHTILVPWTTSEGTNEFSHGHVNKPFSLSYRWKGKGKRVLYKGTGGNISDIQSNSLHVLAYCINALPGIEYTSRMRYTTS